MVKVRNICLYLWHCSMLACVVSANTSEPTTALPCLHFWEDTKRLDYKRHKAHIQNELANCFWNLLHYSWVWNKRTHWVNVGPGKFGKKNKLSPIYTLFFTIGLTLVLSSLRNCSRGWRYRITLLGPIEPSPLDKNRHNWYNKRWSPVQYVQSHNHRDSYQS